MTVITLPCETRVKLFVITTVMQALNVMTNWQLWTNTSQQMFKIPLALTRALRRSHYWLIAWSLMLCWIPDHAKIISSGCFTEYLCMMHPTDLCEMPVSLAIWRLLLCVLGAPFWLSAKSLTASMFSAVRDMRGVYPALNLLCQFLSLLRR